MNDVEIIKESKVCLQNITLCYCSNNLLDFQDTAVSKITLANQWIDTSMYNLTRMYTLYVTMQVTITVTLPICLTIISTWCMLFYWVVARQVISSNHLPEEMQMHGVQYQSPVTTDIIQSKCFVLHTFACLLEDDKRPFIQQLYKIILKKEIVNIVSQILVQCTYLEPRLE